MVYILDICSNYPFSFEFFSPYNVNDHAQYYPNFSIHGEEIINKLYLNHHQMMMLCES